MVASSRTSNFPRTDEPGKCWCYLISQISACFNLLRRRRLDSGDVNRLKRDAPLSRRRRRHFERRVQQQRRLSRWSNRLLLNDFDRLGRRVDVEVAFVVGNLDVTSRKPSQNFADVENDVDVDVAAAEHVVTAVVSDQLFCHLPARVQPALGRQRRKQQQSKMRKKLKTLQPQMFSTWQNLVDLPPIRTRSFDKKTSFLQQQLLQLEKKLERKFKTKLFLHLTQIFSNERLNQLSRPRNSTRRRLWRSSAFFCCRRCCCCSETAAA